MMAPGRRTPTLIETPLFSHSSTDPALSIWVEVRKVYSLASVPVSLRRSVECACDDGLANHAGNDVRPGQHQEVRGAVDLGHGGAGTVVLEAVQLGSDR